MPKADRFSELILFVAKSCQDDPKCGATKLNKILFFCDFKAYEALGSSISGQTYQKLANGPAPKQGVPAIRELERAGDCRWEERRYHGRPLKKLVALREPDLSLFEAAEIEIVRATIERLWDLNATEVSDLSHRFAGWQAAELQEEIPFNTVFVDDPRPLSTEEHEWALQVIGEYCAQKAAGH